MIKKPAMKMTVYRYKVYDHQHDDLAHIPPHYATREYIEQLERTTIIEYDSLEVDESDLDSLGRIAIDK
ncbi:hypothetical protein [Polynucleobacter paneuropaeus]|uniref:hypothetical protein n=1 Tax=Polynucleobacter paneuropaeus TaxID=2527775 RepID=UPI001BFD7C6E|nr:hypothetical protein [Polynucleobacter paneuropaeus]MBT8621503.1 hypothetical protein [Polynucleobacter paneuropaeus]